MSAKDIRNIVLLGHSGSGKTTLAESMLYLTGGTDRLGRIADGNTVCDYDPEEIRRQISISLAVAPVEYDSCKINVLDCPAASTSPVRSRRSFRLPTLPSSSARPRPA